MGRSLTLALCLLVLGANNGVAFTPRVALPGEYCPDIHHPLLPGTPLAALKPLTGLGGGGGRSKKQKFNPILKKLTENFRKKPAKKLFPKLFHFHRKAEFTFNGFPPMLESSAMRWRT
ncbi:hypothetical protein AVEN_99870-1 [Araneus ventricosus]|uniref:Uncharacterized protein n=1 Tax=Araneus ventricosus TaxID=182803 RepID=A0A4Y2J6T2_ARAVE|nr:hypothetical protein AVEN_99870-1 [Araneus ventricosus]